MICKGRTCDIHSVKEKQQLKNAQGSHQGLLLPYSFWMLGSPVVRCVFFIHTTQTYRPHPIRLCLPELERSSCSKHRLKRGALQRGLLLISEQYWSEPRNYCLLSPQASIQSLYNEEEPQSLWEVHTGWEHPVPPPYLPSFHIPTLNLPSFTHSVNARASPTPTASVLVETQGSRASNFHVPVQQYHTGQRPKWEPSLDWDSC